MFKAFTSSVLHKSCLEVISNYVTNTHAYTCVDMMLLLLCRDYIF
jgi:hypothetical protein